MPRARRAGHAGAAGYRHGTKQAVDAAELLKHKLRRELVTQQRDRADIFAAHQHIHLYGHYPFDLAGRPSSYRTLRPPQKAPGEPANTLNRVQR